MSNGLLLWVDDEIELLRAHIIFLEKKGYEVVTVTNGTDAIDQCRQKTFDLILLDEMMPGLSGLVQKSVNYFLHISDKFCPSTRCLLSHWQRFAVRRQKMRRLLACAAAYLFDVHLLFIRYKAIILP